MKKNFYIANFISMIVHILFVLVGIDIIILGIFIQKDNQEFIKNALSTKAIITDIISHYDYTDHDTTYDVYISYNVNGTNYYNKPFSHESGLNIGQSITIYYNSENPEDCRSTNNIEYTGYFIIGFGIFVISISTFSINSFIKSKNNN